MVKLSRFKYNKIIYCLIDCLIILLIAGFVFKLSQTNSQIELLSALPDHQVFCILCEKTHVEYGGDSCCETVTNG
jgi:hypothetical protein